MGLPCEDNAVDRTNFSNRELVRRVAKFGFHSHLFINLQLFQVVESRTTNDANLKSVAFLDRRRYLSNVRFAIPSRMMECELYI